MSELQKPEIPEWAARVGAEVRNRTEQLPTNEPYLVEVTELLRVICESEPRPPRHSHEARKLPAKAV